MKTADYQEELFSLYEEYDAFLAQMVKDEEEKLAALRSNSLPRIGHAITAAQVNAKQMENLEQRRVRLQEKAGFGRMSFSEILDAVPEEERMGLEALFNRIQGYVNEIHTHNKESMGVARDNLRAVDPSAHLEEPVSPMASAYVKAAKNTSVSERSLLETKI